MATPPLDCEMAPTGHPSAATRTLASSVATAFSTTAWPSSLRSKVSGAQKTQLPEPMHRSQSIFTSSASAITSPDHDHDRGRDRQVALLVEAGLPHADAGRCVLQRDGSAAHGPENYPPAGN